MSMQRIFIFLCINAASVGWDQTLRDVMSVILSDPHICERVDGMVAVASGTNASNVDTVLKWHGAGRVVLALAGDAINESQCHDVFYRQVAQFPEHASLFIHVDHLYPDVVHRDMLVRRWRACVEELKSNDMVGIQLDRQAKEFRHGWWANNAHILRTLNTASVDVHSGAQLTSLWDWVEEPASFPLCLTTLTCNNRQTLFDVLRSFVSFTELPSGGLVWVIFMQGCTDDFMQSVRAETARVAYAGIKFILLADPINRGCSYGNNRIAEFSRHFTFVLNVEDDWLTLNPSHTGVDRSWLSLCMGTMNAYNDISSIALRAYATDHEKWQYGWTRHIDYTCHAHRDNFNYEAKMQNKQDENFSLFGIKMRLIPTFLFSLNPVIRRNADYYAKNVFPMPVFNDAHASRNDWRSHNHDTAAQWGCSEALSMEKIRDLRCYMFADGVFGHHEDFLPMLTERNIPLYSPDLFK